MRPDREPPPALSPEVSGVARGSVINIAALVLGALLGFALTVLVSRWLQPRNAGAFFELIALFTILANTLELGADTGLTRWVSRARAIGGLADAPRIVGIALVPVAIAGGMAAAAVWVAAPALAHTFLHGMAPSSAMTDIRIVGAMVPLGALTTCLLAGARGFGRMWPYLAVEGFGKPAARVCLVVTALILGWGLRGAVLAWGLPLFAGLAAAGLILTRLIRTECPPARRRLLTGRKALTAPSPGVSHHLPEDATIAWHRTPEDRRPRGRGPGRHRGPSHRPAARRRRLAREFWRFAAPRGFAGTFQIVVVWLDILLVGALMSRYAAGVYGAVSKLAVVGTFALEGTRLSIAPQLSGLLARRELARAADLYQSATRWLMLASWPLYVVFAIFPTVVLGIFGQRYTAGAAPLFVLALAMLVNLGTGNVGVVLLMGGKSSWNVVNALAALAVNVGLNLVLIPRLGILGAAIAWSASIVLDNVAAVAEVRWLLGLAPFGRGYGLAAAVTLGCFGVTGMAARALLGQTPAALAAGSLVGVSAFAGAAYLARARLQLPGLAAALGLGRGRPQARENSQQAA